MRVNIGTIDKTIRIVIGLGIVISGIILKNFAGLLGVFLLLTGLSGHCPIYAPLGLSTYHKKEEE